MNWYKLPLTKPCQNAVCPNLCRNKFCSRRCTNVRRKRPHLRTPEILAKHRLRPFESLFNRFCAAAESRKRANVLTYGDFLQFTTVSKCHYCGGPINWGRKLAYFLDRKDSTQGYSKENVVVCCVPCNRLKGRMPYGEFLIWLRAWIARISQYLNAEVI